MKEIPLNGRMAKILRLVDSDLLASLREEHRKIHEEPAYLYNRYSHYMKMFLARNLSFEASHYGALLILSFIYTGVESFPSEQILNDMMEIVETEIRECVRR